MAVRAGGAAGGRCRHGVHAASAHGVHMAARAPRGLVGFGFVPHLLPCSVSPPHLPLPSLLGMGGNGNRFLFSLLLLFLLLYKSRGLFEFLPASMAVLPHAICVRDL